MESAEDGERFDASGPLNRASNRRIFVQRLMRYDVVVIACVGSQDSSKMRFAQDHEMVHTLAPDRSDQPFGKTILPRRGSRSRLVADSDNGSELTSNAILTWADQSRVAWHYIAPGKPMQNAFIESFMYRRPRGCKGFRQHFGYRSGAFMYAAF
jgi:hypothetical protein